MELTPEQKMRIDLHKARFARALVERGMLPSQADRTVDATTYEYVGTELRIAHGSTSLSDSEGNVATLADALAKPVANDADAMAEAHVKQINDYNASRPNPLAKR